MAGQADVKVVISGDSKSLDKTFDNVGRGAKEMADKFDHSADRSKSFGTAIDKAADATDKSEGKFMGAADLLDGLGGAFGLPTEGATNLMRSFGDLSGGFAQIGPLIGSMGSSLGALATGPVGLIIAGVAALAVGIIALYKNSETFRDIVSAAFNAVKAVVGPIIDGIGKAVGWVTGLFHSHKEEVKDTGEAYKTMADNLRESLDAQQGKWQSWHDNVTKQLDDIQNPLQRARDKSTVTFDQINKNLDDNIRFYNGWINNLNVLTERGFGALADKMYSLGPTAEKAVGEMVTKSDKELQGLSDKFAAGGAAATKSFTGSFLSQEGLKAMGDAGSTSAMSFTNGFTKGLGPISVPINRIGPAVPHLAAGGIVTSPTLALIGEAGPEAVVPLGAGGPGGNVSVYVSGSVVTEGQLVDAIHEGLLRKQRRTPLGLAS